jgi:hypothetical protein
MDASIAHFHRFVQLDKCFFFVPGLAAHFAKIGIHGLASYIGALVHCIQRYFVSLGRKSVVAYFGEVRQEVCMSDARSAALSCMSVIFSTSTLMMSLKSP